MNLIYKKRGADELEMKGKEKGKHSLVGQNKKYCF